MKGNDMFCKDSGNWGLSICVWLSNVPALYYYPKRLILNFWDEGFIFLGGNDGLQI